MLTTPLQLTFLSLSFLGSETQALGLGPMVSALPGDVVQVVIGEEDRQPSFEPAVGRLRRSRKGYEFCTATLISPSCAITAGHCKRVAELLEFDLELVPNRFTWALKENSFDVDLSSRVFVNEGKGNDWGVFRLKRNSKTGRLPGEERGFYAIAEQPPKDRSAFELIGYGAAENEYSFHQQSSEGTVRTLAPDGQALAWLEHDADTGSSSSGSALISLANAEIVGIHTHGDSDRLVNSGTDLSQTPALKQAIEDCLSSE